MRQKLLLTGGTGFFGRALLRHQLVSKDDQLTIVVLSRDPDRFKAAFPELTSSPAVSFLKADIQNRSSLPWGDSFSHVLHAATDSTLGPSLTPLKRFQQILEGTQNILDLAVAAGAQRFLLTSSGGIYGPQPADLKAIPEDWRGSPPILDTNTAYSQAKRAAEHLCVLYREAHGLETVIARCFAFVGQDLPRDAHFAIGNFIRDALTADSIIVNGDGMPLRTYLDQSDLAQWLFKLLRHGAPGQAYNVGSSEVVSISELAHLVRDLLAPGKPVIIKQQPAASVYRNRYVPDIRKAQTQLGLKVSIPLVTAILRSVRADQ